MRYVSALVVAVALLAVVAWAAAPKSGCPRRDCVVSGADAYCLGAPELVAGQYAKTANWAPVGGALIVTRDTRRSDDAPGELVLSSWNAASHRLTDLWRRPAGTHELEDLKWFASSTLATVAVRQQLPSPDRDHGRSQWQTTAALLVDAARGQLRTILPPPALRDAAILSVDPAPALPVAVVTLGAHSNSEDFPRWLWVLRADGSGGPWAQVPAGCQTAMWAADGKRFLLSQRVGDMSPGVRRTYRWYAFDPASGRIDPIEKPPQQEPASSRPRPFIIERRAAEARAGSIGAPVPSVWMLSTRESAYARVLVAADAESPEESPAHDAVAYEVNGSLWARPIVRKPAEQFEKEYREWATDAAKQLNLAIMMYTQDYDEIYPPLAGVQDSVSPYVRNPALMGELRYALNGESLVDIAAPADREIGYVDGPGGRVAMYADGHVKWQPNR